MSNIHIFLQGKGGVGKSFCASMLAQYKIHHGANLLCVDTDPVNATLASYPTINAFRVDILDGTKIDGQKFDSIFEAIDVAPEGTTAIIDNGASSFVSFADYLISQDVPTFLQDMGHKVFINTVITGGDALADTLNGFQSLARQLNDPNVGLIVWLNPYFGPITLEGKSFEELKVYKEHKGRVSAIFNMPKFNEDTFGKDLLTVLKARQTLTDALTVDPPYNLMCRQRIIMMQRGYFQMLDTFPEL